MSNKRDEFDKPTVEALAKRAAYICSNPDCKTLTIAPSSVEDTKVTYIGKAAHITAAAEGGPRYNPDLSPEDRKSIDNGIFLCSNCADMIDKNKGVDYPIKLLVKWKNEHDTWISENLNMRVYAETKSNQTFVVTSHQQSGGITAGVVNVGPQQRSLDSTRMTQLNKLLTDKSKEVTVTCVLGDSESYKYAIQIKEYLLGQGFSVRGVNQAVFRSPKFGQMFDPETVTITIGTKQ